MTSISHFFSSNLGEEMAFQAKVRNLVFLNRFTYFNKLSVEFLSKGAVLILTQYFERHETSKDALASIGVNP